MHQAPIQKPLKAKQAGVIQKMDAESIGRAAVFLGAGRQKAGDEIDFAVGFSAIKKIGEEVAVNEPLMLIHARDDHSLGEVMPLLERAIEIN